MMYGASVHDARVQFLRPLVKPGKVLLTNCGVSIAYRIYLVMPDPGRFPDVEGGWQLQFSDGYSCTHDSHASLKYS